VELQRLRVDVAHRRALDRAGAGGVDAHAAARGLGDGGGDAGAAVLAIGDDDDDLRSGVRRVGEQALARADRRAQVRSRRHEAALIPDAIDQYAQCAQVGGQR
jgi:hypothetical protein